MTDEERTAVLSVIHAITRINTALRGQFYGGYQEAREIQEQLDKARDALQKDGS